MAWSILSPLLMLLVMRLVFTQFFGSNTPHYTTYLFCGNLVFSFFSDSTSQGMSSLLDNAGIFTKVNVPKYLFLFSKNVQCLINFGLTLCVFFVFCILDGITFTWRFIFLFYPICCLTVINIGVGLILSALFVFFRDMQYLWRVCIQILMYVSAIFYTVDKYDATIQRLIRKTKSLPIYKEKLAEVTRMTYEEVNADTEAFTDLFKKTPALKTESEVNMALSRVSQKHYTPLPFTEEAPDKNEIERQLQSTFRVSSRN